VQRSVRLLLQLDIVPNWEPFKRFFENYDTIKGRRIMLGLNIGGLSLQTA